MQILEHEFTDKPTCGNTTVTHTETDIDQTFIHVHSCVARYTRTKHASANSNRHTGMYHSMLTYVYTLTQKPTVQHTDLTHTHEYICAHTGTHRYTYAHRHTYLVTQISTHT